MRSKSSGEIGFLDLGGPHSAPERDIRARQILLGSTARLRREERRSSATGLAGPRRRLRSHFKIVFSAHWRRTFEVGVRRGITNTGESLIRACTRAAGLVRGEIELVR